MATKTTAAYRHKYATVKTKGGDEKYPIHDEEHAESAIKLINRAKPPLSSSQKASVRRRAAAYGVTSAASATKPAKKGKPA